MCRRMAAMRGRTRMSWTGETAAERWTAEGMKMLLMAGAVAGEVVLETASDAPVRQFPVPVMAVPAPERQFLRSMQRTRGQCLPLPDRNAPGTNLRCVNSCSGVDHSRATVLGCRSCVACTEL